MTTKSDLLRHAKEGKALAEYEIPKTGLTRAGLLFAHGEQNAHKHHAPLWQRMIELIEAMPEDSVYQGECIVTPLTDCYSDNRCRRQPPDQGEQR